MVGALARRVSRRQRGCNGTLIGASSNLTVAGIAERNGVPFRFLTYTKLAFPLMIIHVAIAHVYMLWRYL